MAVERIILPVGARRAPSPVRDAAREKIGTVVQVDGHGLAFVKTVEDGRMFSFTFDKISSYSGETAGELGLVPGSLVRFFADNGVVKKVEKVAIKPESYGFPC
jgi:hypothetical protein